MIDEKTIPEIKKDYQKGYTYKQIAEKYKITYNQVTYLIKKEKWKRKSNLSITHKGNSNAKGNKGGTGAKKGNKNAVTTHEYETILYGALNDEEQKLYNQLKLEDKRKCIEQEYKVLTIREFRIMKKIKEIQEKNKETNIEEIVNRRYDSFSAKTTQTETRKVSTITQLQKLEDSLTRVQDAKRKCLDTLHKMETDDRKLELDIIRLELETSKNSSGDEKTEKDDSFIKALEDNTESVWSDYESEETN